MHSPQVCLIVKCSLLQFCSCKLRMRVSITVCATVQRLSIFLPLTGRLSLWPASEATLGSPVIYQVVAMLR